MIFNSYVSLPEGKLSSSTSFDAKKPSREVGEAPDARWNLFQPAIEIPGHPWSFQLEMTGPLSILKICLTLLEGNLSIYIYIYIYTT